MPKQLAWPQWSKLLLVAIFLVGIQLPNVNGQTKNQDIPLLGIPRKNPDSSRFTFLTHNLKTTGSDIRQWLLDLDSPLTNGANEAIRFETPPEIKGLSNDGPAINRMAGLNEGWSMLKLDNSGILSYKKQTIQLKNFKELELFPFEYQSTKHFFLIDIKVKFACKFQGFLFLFPSEEAAKSQIEHLKNWDPNNDPLNEKTKKFGLFAFANNPEKNLTENISNGPFKKKFSPNEKKLIEAFKTVRVPQLVLGAKYKEKTLSGRFIAPGNWKNLANFIDFDAHKTDWRPLLGFRQKNFLGSASVNYRSFRTSTGPHLVATAFAGEGLFLHNTKLRNLIDLMADAWMDCDCGRIGIYLSPTNDPNAPTYNIIGILDNSRSNDVIISELENISTLTSGNLSENEKELQRKEIVRWTKHLGEDSNLAARAETRLLLAGSRASEQLKAVIESTESTKSAVENAKRIQEIITITKTASTKRNRPNDVMSPMFWFNLDPKLKFVKGKTVDGRGLHKVIISPDPSKTKEEIAEASAVMKKFFGPDWNTIKINEIPGHFIFMLGSDNQLLEEIAGNVEANQTGLKLAKAGPITGDIQGPIQIAFDLNNLVLQQKQGFFRLGNRNADQQNRPVCRFGILPTPTHLELWIRIPMKALKPILN